MFQFISDIKGIKSREVIGVNIYINHQEETIIDYVILSRKKDNVKLKTTGSCKNLIELTKMLPDMIPISLSLDGKWIINKIIESKENGNELESVLPNANINDFVIQKLSIGRGKYFFSVIRKDKLDGILNELVGLNLLLFNVFLGPVSSFDIISHINHSEVFLIPHYQFIFEGREIIDIKKTSDLIEDREFSIENDTLKINYLIPFTNCICIFKKTDSVLLDLILIKEQREKFYYKKIFKLCGSFVLSFLLISLLVNYLIFEDFRSKNQILFSQVEDNKELLKVIQQKQFLLKTREELLMGSSFTQNPLFAYYSDRIAKEVPLEISLIKMELSPQEKTTLNKDLIHFMNNKIIINGITRGSAYLDSWIKVLKTHKWISDIIITNYYDSNIEPARFDLEIMLNDKPGNEISK